MTDWSKMNINRIKGWDANKNPEFWYLTGLDQLVHQLTYLGIVTVVFINIHIAKEPSCQY